MTGTPSDPNTANNSSTIFTTVSAPSTAPTVSTCVPGAAKPGAATSVVVTGTGFKSGASADFGARVTVQSVTVNGSTQLTVKIKVNPNAAIGPRTVTVTNTDGQSGSNTGETITGASLCTGTALVAPVHQEATSQSRLVSAQASARRRRRRSRSPT